MSSVHDTWPLPLYNPGPPTEHIHALGVIALTYAKLQRSMDDLFLNKARTKQIPSDWAGTYYYALSEDKRSEAIKGIYKEDEAEVFEAIENIVKYFDWCRNCRKGHQSAGT
jgi:hypothetical protein